MVERGDGRKIINICSQLSYQGGINIPGYTAAKSGLAGITRAMANELAPRKINVNGIAHIRTDNTVPLQTDPKRSEAILAGVPAGHCGEAEDLIGAAVFLAGPGFRLCAWTYPGCRWRMDGALIVNALQFWP